MRYLFTILLYLVKVCSATIPSGCEPIISKDDSIHINNKQSGIYYFHNISTTNIYLAFVDDGRGRLTTLTSLLTPNNFSALAVSINNIHIKCVESRPGSEQQIDCRGLIDVCKMVSIKGLSDIKDTYWLANDLSLTGVNAKLAYSGIKLGE